MYFNPRSREGSDSEADYTQNEDYVFQSTLPRRERHARSLIPCLHHLISIHAPAKGATGQQRLSAPETCISIHAPAKGATYQHRSLPTLQGNFNPRSREGSDEAENGKQALELISIHAPAKGATKTAWKQGFGYKEFQSTLPRRERLLATVTSDVICDFNPRSREGSDLYKLIDELKDAQFQSTLPRRERLQRTPRSTH